MRSALVEAGLGADVEETAEGVEEVLAEVEARRNAIADRLRSLEMPSESPLQSTAPFVDQKALRRETHRDVLLKELCWMSADFDTERKRHNNLRKKLAKSVLHHFRALETKRSRSSKDSELSLKRLAAKASKFIKQFWFKIDKVIAYERRLRFENAQRKNMDKALVTLVRQTERYAGDLAQKLGPSDVASRLEDMDREARSRDVARPFLLDSKLSLRPYQQVGLNWLASMHSRRLNGILADEMGLGKTVQAISLLAHLASSKGVWGPHLVVAPTSVLVNWEMELKKFCPAFKVVTYYGSAKARKRLRAGWSKPGAFHVCVTSYQLAVQDATVFRRKKFYYLILDEAHNIKNFESRRWRTLLSFQAQRRLLLTGTPLQNSLIELWSLMHFLMPHLFRSRAEFSYWFANPLSSAVEGRSKLSDDLVKRLHAILRPFVLRRLKKDVAKQLPGKHEHEVRCSLSRRQQLLYEDFMSRSSTRVALAKNQSVAQDGADFVSMMNVVMQLRKVCNHPDLFEPRPIVAPFVFPRLDITFPGIACFSQEEEIPTFLSDDTDVLERRRSLFASDDLTLAPFEEAPSKIFFDDMHVSDVDERFTVNFENKRRQLKNYASETLLRFHRLTRQQQFFCVSPRTRLFLRRSIVEKSPFFVASRAFIAESSLLRNRARFEASSIALDVVEKATLEKRYHSMKDVLDRFILVVPKAVAKSPRFDSQCPLSLKKNPTFKKDDSFAVLRPVELGLTVSFPDRSLVQWDSGKFHSLAPLLRNLKKENHRCLIFTQMSKMLDVLEAFLCFHGHTYSRLDGATQPDERQRRVDRFNTDENIFCMVLSTRSGGLGINLTGADVVIFYDSDWNPAMDAQATDRAHRIGQTREVHIYRLVCTATVEENILMKAKQKRRLNHVAITEGHFDASDFNNEDDSKWLNLVEDEEDVEDAKRAEKEADEEAKEFDQQQQIDNDEKSVADSVDNNKQEDALEAEFAAWQERVGPDPEKLTAALKPIERLSLSQRALLIEEGAVTTTVTTFLPPPAPPETDDADVEAIEEEKREDEERACRDGDILVSDLYFDNKESNILDQKREFSRRRRLAHAETARRRCTGAAWERRVDASNGESFWYNVDTYEWSWRAPAIIQRRDAEADARRGGYGMLAKDVLARVLASLKPGQTRGRFAVCCRSFATASRDDRFAIQVLPAEKVAALRLAKDHEEETSSLSSKKKKSGNNAIVKKKTNNLQKRKRRGSMELNLDSFEPEEETSESLSAAVRKAPPGSTLVLCPGHYWEEGDIIVDKALRIVGDVTEPTRVVVELGGSLRWRAKAGAIAGLSIRRPKISQTATHALVIDGTLYASKIAVDNYGAGGAAIYVGPDAKLFLDQSRVSRAKASGLMVFGTAGLSHTAIVDNGAYGIFAQPDSSVFARDSHLLRNKENPFLALPESLAAFVHCDLSLFKKQKIQDALVISKNCLGLRDTVNGQFFAPKESHTSVADDEEKNVLLLSKGDTKKRPRSPQDPQQNGFREEEVARRADVIARRADANPLPNNDENDSLPKKVARNNTITEAPPQQNQKTTPVAVVLPPSS